MQSVVTALSLLAVGLSQSPSERARRYACLAGLAAQPFWFVIQWSHGLHLLAVLSLVYAAVWLRGVRTYWWGVARGN
jgi:hypothetical protein